MLKLNEEFVFVFFFSKLLNKLRQTSLLAIQEHNNIILLPFAVELYSGAPLDVQLTNANADELTFSWNSVNSNCESARLSRNIMFDCGTCRTTSESTAVCTGLQIPSTCDFSIQNVVCGQVGSMSTPVTVTLKGTACNSRI